MRSRVLLGLLVSSGLGLLAAGAGCSSDPDNPGSGGSGSSSVASSSSSSAVVASSSSTGVVADTNRLGPAVGEAKPAMDSGLAAGKAITDEALSKMDYYVEGVQGKIPASK